MELESHEETVELADRLESEGLHVLRRWRFLLLGARTEEEAQALAARIRAEAPPGTKVTPEGNEALVRRFRLERLAGVSHWVMHDAPDVVNRLVGEWARQQGLAVQA